WNSRAECSTDDRSNQSSNAAADRGARHLIERNMRIAFPVPDDAANREANSAADEGPESSVPFCQCICTNDREVSVRTDRQAHRGADPWRGALVASEQRQLVVNLLALNARGVPKELRRPRRHGEVDD